MSSNNRYWSCRVKCPAGVLISSNKRSCRVKCTKGYIISSKEHSCLVLKNCKIEYGVVSFLLILLMSNIKERTNLFISTKCYYECWNNWMIRRKISFDNTHIHLNLLTCVSFQIQKTQNFQKQLQLQLARFG